MSRKLWQRSIVLAVASVAVAAGTACAAQAPQSPTQDAGLSVDAAALGSRSADGCGKGGEGGKGGKPGQPGEPGEPGRPGCADPEDLKDLKELEDLEGMGVEGEDRRHHPDLPRLRHQPGQHPAMADMDAVEDPDAHRGRTHRLPTGGIAPHHLGDRHRRAPKPPKPCVLARELAPIGANSRAKTEEKEESINPAPPRPGPRPGCRGIPPPGGRPPQAP